MEEIARTLQAEGAGYDIFWIGNRPLAGYVGCGTCTEKRLAFLCRNRKRESQRILFDKCSDSLQYMRRIGKKAGE